MKLTTKQKKILIRDHSTGNNIIFACKSYPNKSFSDQITVKDIKMFVPRREKAIEEQNERKEINGEVFTPHVIVKMMASDLYDECDIHSLTLEPCCGEAPFIADLYDRVDGHCIDFDNRTGLLDMKCKKCKSAEDILDSLKSSYGVELQGDSLYLGRMNAVQDAYEWYDHLFGACPDEKTVDNMCEIVAWNIIQMDMLTFKTPTEDNNEEMCDPRIMSLWDDPVGNSPTWGIVADWQAGKPVPTRFVDIGKKVE